MFAHTARETLNFSRAATKNSAPGDTLLSGTEIGAYLLGLWGIPTLAVEAIAHHHHLTRISHSGFDSTVAVYVAGLLAHELEAHPQDTTGLELDSGDRVCLEMLGVLPRFAEFRKLGLQCATGSA
jgi:HD-like signal output (HDOD) protein